jgi:hypothetical protein
MSNRRKLSSDRPYPGYEQWVPTGGTFRDLWEGLDTAGKRQIMLDWHIKVYAKGARRGEPDLAVEDKVIAVDWGVGYRHRPCHHELPCEPEVLGPSVLGFTHGCQYFYACEDEVGARKLQGRFGGWLAKRETHVTCDGRIFMEFHHGWSALPLNTTENWLVCSGGHRFVLNVDQAEDATTPVVPLGYAGPCRCGGNEAACDIPSIPMAGDPPDMTAEDADWEVQFAIAHDPGDGFDKHAALEGRDAVHKLKDGSVVACGTDEEIARQHVSMFGGALRHHLVYKSGLSQRDMAAHTP